MEEKRNRQQYIGGTDIHHLFSLEPYGCIRHLWYAKNGIKPDFPFFGNVDTDRGIFYEPIVADLYAERTGRAVSAPRDYNFEGWGGGRPDKIIHDVEKGYGILEIKCPGRYGFRRIKSEGLLYSNILQLQHYLFLTGYLWGSFAIFWPDEVELATFDVERDEEIISKIKKKGNYFWNEILLDKNGPDRLDAKDSRCLDCGYRTTCQGLFLVEKTSERPYCVEIDGLEEMVAEYLEKQEELKIAEDSFSSISEKIKAAMGDNTISKTKDAKITYKAQKRKTFDSKGFLRLHPEFSEEFTRESVSRVLRIKRKK